MVTRMLSHLKGLKQFPNPYAPNFAIIGAQVTGQLVEHLENALYVMGKGHSIPIAQARLCGEAAERVAMLSPAANKTWKALDPDSGERIDIDPYSFFGPGWRPRSHGCATHNMAENASLSAIEELLERRAVQDWWEGQANLHLLTNKSPLFDGLFEQVRKMRTGAIEQRETRFCVIGDNPNVFVVAAISHDRDFDQIAVGFSAGTSLASVFYRAFEELLSVELEASDLYRAYLDGDEIPKGSNRYLVRERQQVMRMRLTDELKNCSAITSEMSGKRPYSNAAELLKHLNETNDRVLLVDITHPDIGVPATRAIFADAERNPFLFEEDDAVLPL